MAPLNPAIDPEELLAQAGWVRGIVRRLVLDEAMAEDVLQDTWVAALQSPPGARDHGGLRAWLGVVARNLARRRHRREVLRTAVERAAARREAVGEGPDGVERMQLQGALVEAVLALEEPYRDAVILRHLDGLSAAEIARRQGCTSAAARQRVSRGLAQLRARLAREHGRGPLALLPLVGKNWNGSLLAGGMAVGSKTILGAACVALTALALWMATTLGDERNEPAAAEPVARAAGSGLEAQSEAELSAEIMAPSPAAPVASEPEARVPTERSPTAAVTEKGTPQVLGRVTDTKGQPLADATLTIVLEGGATEFASADDGTFAQEVSGLHGTEATLRARCEGYLERTVTVEASLFATIELQALPSLHGRLVDPFGAAVAPPGYVRVEILDATTRESRTSKASLRADGSFFVEGLPLGRLVQIEARARGFATTELPMDRVLEPDESTEVDVQLVQGAVVAGTVLDTKTGEPLPGATVWMENFSPEQDSVHPHGVADDQGRFRLEGANEEVSIQNGQRYVVFWLLAQAEGYVASPLTHYSSTASDEHTYDFEMRLEPAGCSLEVHAKLDDGSPAGGASVWAIDAQANPFFESADEEGVHRFENLPAGRLGLWLTFDDPEGRLHARRAEVELAPGEARTFEVTLDPPRNASLVGRLEDVLGRGVAGFPVRCQLQFQLGNLILASGYVETETGPDGHYRFAGLHPGKYQVWAHGEGSAMACTYPGSTYIDVADEEESEVELLCVGACFTIEGRVGESGVAMAELQLEARDPASGQALAETRPASDGSFRFEPLVAQDYEVLLFHGEEVLDRVTANASSASGLFLRPR